MRSERERRRIKRLRKDLVGLKRNGRTVTKIAWEGRGSQVVMASVKCANGHVALSRSNVVKSIGKCQRCIRPAPGDVYGTRTVVGTKRINGVWVADCTCTCGKASPVRLGDLKRGA